MYIILCTKTTALIEPLTGKPRSASSLLAVKETQTPKQRQNTKKDTFWTR